MITQQTMTSEDPTESNRLKSVATNIVFTGSLCLHFYTFTLTHTLEKTVLKFNSVLAPNWLKWYLSLST